MHIAVDCVTVTWCVCC